MSGNVLHSTLIGTSALAAIVSTRIYARGSLGINGIPAKPTLPYVMHGEEEATRVEEVRETGPKIKRTTWVIYVYDEPGSFVRIKDIHDIIQGALESMGSVASGGVRVVEVLFDRSSRDGLDTVRQENVKSANYRVVYTRYNP